MKQDTLPDKIRMWNVTFHNVDELKANAILLEYVKDAQEYLFSVEPYPNQPGHHAHLTIVYRNQRYFKPVLKELEKIIKKAIALRPPGETRHWGRVHLEKTRGTLEQNIDYLKGLTKDKPLGEIHQGKRTLKEEKTYCTLRHGQYGRMYDPDCPECQDQTRLGDWIALQCGYVHQAVKKNLSPE